MHLIAFVSFAWPVAAVAAVGIAVSVPLLIHLLSRQRYQVVPWAATRFLRIAQKKHRRRIDRWALLAARILALLLPLAAMCAVAPWAESAWQWIVPGPPERISIAPRTHHILLIDASLSLTAKTDTGSRFDTAIAKAEQVVRTANPGDGFTVILLANTAQVVVPGPSNDPEKVLTELRSLRVTHGSADLAAGLAAAGDALARSPRAYPRRQVLLFSDLQRSAFAGLLPRPEGPPPEVWQRVLPRADVAVVDVALEDADNLAIADLSLADPLPLVDQMTVITAAIQNFGKSDRSQVRVELSIGRPSAGGPDTTLLPVEQRMIDTIPAGQRVGVTFALEGAARFREAGLHLIRLKILDEDRVAADDLRYLAVEVRAGLPTLLVNGTPSADPWKRATEYLSEALDPGGRKLPGNPARPRVVSPTEFADAALGDLSAIDAVFLCDLPTVTPFQVAKLEAHLKRGGGVIVGLGPNAAANLDGYNRVLFAEGTGLLPGPLLGVKTASETGFRLAADDDAYRRPPLAVFRDDNSRAGLTSVPFRKYVRLEAPADGRARRILSFVPAKSVTPPGSAEEEGPEPAVVEWPRHRGRVIVYTSTFNTEWTDWPVLPSYLPFAHELLRFAVANPDRHTLRVGERIEEFLPPTAIGLMASITGPENLSATAPVASGDEVGLVTFAETFLSGLYRVSVGGRREALFAVNVPESTMGGGSESDLRRIDPSELRAIGSVQVVSDPGEVKIGGDGEPVVLLLPRAHGPTLARWLLLAAIAVLLFELWLAWRLGPARTALPVRAVPSVADPPRSRVQSLLALLGLAPIVATGLILLTVFHAESTGDLFGFLPASWRGALEQAVGVPAAGPGEGTRWRLEGVPAFLSNPALDRVVILGLMTVGALLVAGLYQLERRAAGGLGRLIIPGLLRLALLGLIAVVLLPQLRLAFDREGWPDLAIVLDTSASMATDDDLTDPSVRAKADELKAALQWPDLTRLRLAKALLTRPDGDWLTRILTERQFKIHLYALDEQPRLLTEVAEAADIPAAKDEIAKLAPDGSETRLGDGLQTIIKAFRGGSLTGIVVFTDGIVTAGDDLPQAGREAARANVPLYLVGLGDAREPPDLALSDLKADDMVLKGDDLVFEARVTVRGTEPPKDVPVILFERQGDTRVERGRTTVPLDPSGKPVPVRLSVTPMDVGQKTYVIELPTLPGETDTDNNRLERVVTVAESRTLRVLYVEGYPRYEYRFVKALLERETDTARGGKSVDLQTVLLDASPGYAEQDKSARRTLPTRAELFDFDVVFLGDIDPAQVPKAPQFFQDISEFVKVRGGGLLFIAGEQANPQKLFGSPLGDLLPVLPSDAATPKTSVVTAEGYQPKLTPLGQGHPLFRFVPDEVENGKIWQSLRPLLWSAEGYRRKPTAEVLAVHPDRVAEGGGENHPLVLQQFVGGGRVLFLGVDETWRWRFRAGEDRFNQFWLQAVRVLARGRVTRVELRTDKQTAYRRGDPIRVTVRFPDDAPVPAADVPVRVAVSRVPLRNRDGRSLGPAPDTQTIQLSKVEGSRATYQGLLTRTPEGDYRFVLADPPTNGNKPWAEATVLPPPGELERLDPDRVAMTRAATESRGKAYTLADADMVLNDLPDVPRVVLDQPVPPIPVWSHPALFGLVVIVFAAEWWLRRQERLL